MNELQALTKFEVTFTPSVIEIANEEKLADFIEKMVATYDSLVFRDESIKDAKEARKELNNLFTAIDTKRKEVKKDYSKPLVSFEKSIKTYSDQVKKVSDKIKTQIDEYEEKERAHRLEILQQEIEGLGENSGFPDILSEITIKDSWLNKSSFNASGDVNKKTCEEIQEAILLIIQEKNRIKADCLVIENLAKAYDLEPESWVDRVKHGSSSAELIPHLEMASKEKKERLAKEEQNQKAKAEYEEAMKQLEAEKQKEVGHVLVDTETGEVIEDIPEKTVEIQTAVLEIRGTIEQFQALNQYMVANGIQVRSLD